jgi:ribonuclease-3
MDSLETRIGYKFNNSLLLAEALTHPSLAYESKRPHFDNQRLEYLGDAVIQLILTNELYQRFPKFAEGRLTKLRSRLVSRDGLCEYAYLISLGDYLLLGKGEAASGGRERPSNLADAIEALAGAVYLDGGYAAATEFIMNNFISFIDEIANQPDDSNPKGKLQEHLQSITQSSPSYSIISQEGPDHEKSFVSQVSWEGILLGEGDGKSKKEAEIKAASDALELKKWLTEKEALKDCE